MEFLAEKLHGRKRAIHQLVLDIAVFLVCFFLVWKGIELVQVIYQSGKTTHSGELEVWYMMLAIPVGGVIYGIYGISEIIKIICVIIAPDLSDQMFASHLNKSNPSDELSK